MLLKISSIDYRGCGKWWEMWKSQNAIPTSGCVQELVLVRALLHDFFCVFIWRVMKLLTVQFLNVTSNFNSTIFISEEVVNIVYMVFQLFWHRYQCGCLNIAHLGTCTESKPQYTCCSSCLKYIIKCKTMHLQCKTDLLFIKVYLFYLKKLQK